MAARSSGIGGSNPPTPATIMVEIIDEYGVLGAKIGVCKWVCKRSLDALFFCFIPICGKSNSFMPGSIWIIWIIWLTNPVLFDRRWVIFTFSQGAI